MIKKEEGDLLAYIKSMDFRKTLLAIIVFLGICMLASFLWLKMYTHHGEELAMPDYTGYKYEDALADAEKRKLRMSIQDSLHILGRPGGIILKQNPIPTSLVKSNRMIYVTITKRGKDKIISARLPEMYGKSYERKKQELADHFQIKSRIVDSKYDPGDPGQILSVLYKGEVITSAKGRNNEVQIEKGDYLEFVISAKTGGDVEIPDLTCKTYEEALFILENLNLKMGSIKEIDAIDDTNAAYILYQEPTANGSMIQMESPIHVTIQQLKPGSCL